MTIDIDSRMESHEGSMAAEERELWILWKRHGDSVARGRLMERYLWLPRIVASKALKAGRYASDLDQADLIQAATIAMIESMKRFDIEANVGFANFASKRIRGAILNSIDNASDFRAQLALARDLKKERLGSLSGSVDIADRLRRVVDIAVGIAVGILLEDTPMFVDETSQVGSPYSSGDLLILRQNLIAIVASLPEQEQRVVKYHYYHDLSFAHIADVMGLTRARISQIHSKAMLSVRRRYADTGNYDQLA